MRPLHATVITMVTLAAFANSANALTFGSQYTQGQCYNCMGSQRATDCYRPLSVGNPCPKSVVPFHKSFSTKKR